MARSAILLLCVRLFCAPGAAGDSRDGWDEAYLRAIGMTTRDPEGAIALFRDVAANAEPVLAGRALLQIGVIYRHTLMEPRLALQTHQEFQKRPGAGSHPGYAISERAVKSLSAALGEVDAVEARIVAAATDGERVPLLMEVGALYRDRLDAPKYGYDAYQRAFLASKESHDVAYYMMAYSMMEWGDLEEAAAMFEVFMMRFPTSYLFPSALELEYRCLYLTVFGNPVPFVQRYEAERLRADLDKVLSTVPDLQSAHRSRLERLRELTSGLAEETPVPSPEVESDPPTTATRAEP